MVPNVDIVMLIALLGFLLWFPPTRNVTKVWVLLSLLLVWLLDSAARDVLGD